MERDRLLLIVFVVIACLTKCQTTPERREFPEFNRDQLNPARENVEAASDQVGEASKAIKGSAGVIKQEADQTEAVIPNDIRPAAVPHLNTIRKEAGNIEDNTVALDEAESRLRQSIIELAAADKAFKAVEGEYNQAVSDLRKAEDARDEAIADRDSAARKMLTWLIVLSVVGIGVSGALIFFGSPKMGIMGIAISAGVLVVAITVTKYFDYIAWGGLGLIVIIAGFAIYHLFIQKQVIFETVRTGEVMKNRLSKDHKKHIFGDGAEPGVAHSLQSGSTMKLVDKARRKMKKQIEPTIRYGETV